jgi:hypothetical protein
MSKVTDDKVTYLEGGLRILLWGVYSGGVADQGSDVLTVNVRNYTITYH